jgi:hypothetical protein
MDHAIRNAYQRGHRYDERMRTLALVAAMRFMEPPPPPTRPPPPRLPIFKLDENIGTCGICLEPMLKNHEILWLPCQPTVNHAFHTHCIEPWLHRKKSCPTCRGTW